MPDGGARSATLERMSAVSLTGVVRERNACADHSGLMPVVDTYRLAVASPLSLLTFFAAAKKVSAAPHRGIANRPIRQQGKAKATRTTTKAPRRQKNTAKPQTEGIPPKPPSFRPIARSAPEQQFTIPALRQASTHGIDDRKPARHCSAGHSWRDETHHPDRADRAYRRRRGRRRHMVLHGPSGSRPRSSSSRRSGTRGPGRAGVLPARTHDRQPSIG